MSAYACSDAVYHHHGVQAVLAPGEALQRCSGQDILKRGAPSGKGKHRLLIVLPVQLALPPLGADCRLGRLLHLLSPAPEYHLQIEQGTLVFVGEYVHPTNRFLSVHCPPVGRADDRGCGQCSMTDVFDRLLVFNMPRFVPTRALSSGSDPTSSHGEAVEAAPYTVTTRFGVSSLSNLSKATKSTNCKKASGSTGNQGSIPMMGSVSDNDDDDDDSDGDEDDTVSSSDEVALPSGSRVATRRPSAVTQRISYKDDSSSEEERDSGPSNSKNTKALKAVKKTSTTSTVPPRSKTLLGKRGRGRHDDGSDGDSKGDSTSDDPSYDEDWHEVTSPSGNRVATRRPSAVTQRISYKDDSSTSSEEERDSGPSKSKNTKASTVVKKISTTSTVPPRSRADRKTPLGKRGRGKHDGDCKVTRHSLTRDTSAAAEPTVIVLDD